MDNQLCPFDVSISRSDSQPARSTYIELRVTHLIFWYVYQCYNYSSTWKTLKIEGIRLELNVESK